MREPIATLLFLIVLAGLPACKKFESISEGANVVAGACLTKLRSLSSESIDRRLCEEMTSYSCEKRVYSPNVSNRDSLVEECGVGAAGDACVSVRVLEFNTEIARAGSAPAEFLPGGEYHRTDIQCVNRALNYKNVSLIEGEGSDVRSALNTAVQKCYERSSL